MEFLLPSYDYNSHAQLLLESNYITWRISCLGVVKLFPTWCHQTHQMVASAPKVNVNTAGRWLLEKASQRFSLHSSIRCTHFHLPSFTIIPIQKIIGLISKNKLSKPSIFLCCSLCVLRHLAAESTLPPIIFSKRPHMASSAHICTRSPHSLLNWNQLNLILWNLTILTHWVHKW